MRTICYCVYCPKHPLFEKRNNLRPLTGWSVGDVIYNEKYLKQGKEVDCLEPVSDAFSELDVDPKDHLFPITAYGDGVAFTGFDGRGYEITAQCENEEYEE